MPKASNERQIKNIGRKVLHTLQPVAEEQVVHKKQEVTDIKMVKPKDETLKKEKQPKINEKLILAEKENTPIGRRPKRKTALATKNYAESPKLTRTAKTATKSKKVKSKAGCSVNVKKSEQTKLQFSPVVTNVTLKKNLDELKSDNLEKDALVTSIPETTGDSGLDVSSPASNEICMNSTAILKSPKDIETASLDVSMITGEVPNLMYWKLLAEQRRIALEKTLHENELLHDQLTVLETENSQLKQLVKEAENLAETLRAVIG